jgi:recombination protein RecT
MSNITIRPIDEVRKTLSSPAMIQEIRRALPSHVDAERFARVATTAIAVSEAKGQNLLDCERNSLYAACMACAQVGLLPDGREAALVKFGNKVQFMPMVEGLMKQVRNSGEIANISVHEVKEKDFFYYELGDNEVMTHKPLLSNRGETIGAYSIVTLKNGEKSREWMDKDQIDAIRKRSKSGNAGPWVSDYDEMAKKTVFRRHYKRLPKSTDLDAVIEKEEREELQQVAPKKEEPKEVVQDKPVRNSVLQSVVDSVEIKDAVVEQNIESSPIDKDAF